MSKLNYMQFKVYWDAPEQAELRKSCAKAAAKAIWDQSRRAIVVTVPAQYGELKQTCEKVTPGAWWMDSHGHRMYSADTLATVFIADDRMGPATRHPETGNLSHWPNDWDCSYIVAAQPKTVKVMLDSIDQLKDLGVTMVTYREQG